MPHVNVDGVNLYYEDTGSGMPIVFVHEYAGDYRSWENQVRYFSRRYRCITFNARGYPPSDVPEAQEAYSQDIILHDIRSLLGNLEIEAAHFVGLSMGSYTTLVFGLRYPEHVTSMVVAGTGYGAMPGNRDQFLSEIVDLSASFEAGGGPEKSKILSSKNSRNTLKQKSPRSWREFADQMKEHSGLGSALTFRGVQTSRPMFTDIERELKESTVPLLLMVGDEDPASMDGTLYIKNTAPSAGLLMLPKTGHTINLEEPDFFNHAVESFINDVAAGKWRLRDPRALAQQSTAAAG